MTLQSACGLFSLVGLVTLAACGGGGGGGNSPTAATLQITPQNSRATASTAFNGSQGVTTVAGASSGAFARLEGTAPRRFDLARHVTKQVEDFAAGPVLMVIDPITFAGSGGGTATATFTDADNDGVLEAGDSITITYTNFNEDGFILNGTLTIAINVLTESQTSSTLQATITLNLNLSEGGVTKSATGSLRIQASETASQEVAGLTVLTDLVTGDERLAANSFFETTETETTFSEILRGAIEDASLGGRVTFDTQLAFSGDNDDDFPSAGIFVISGTGGSKLRLTALDNTTVRIELDSDGDGQFDDFSDDVAWADLIGEDA